MRIGIRTPRKLWLAAVIVCVAAFSPTARGQSIDLDANRLAVSPVDSSWRFHPGDDPRWSQPDFDDSGWKTIDPRTDWSTQGLPRKVEFVWFRFQLRLPPHMSSLVLELPRIHRNYQVFSDGKLIGQSGKLPPDHAQMVGAAARVFTLPIHSGAHPQQVSVAIRLWQDPTLAGLYEGVLLGRAYVGQAEPLLHQFAVTKDAALLSRGNEYTLDVICLIVGAATLLLLWLTRERFYLWFACYLVSTSIDLPITLASQHFAWPFWFTLYLYIFTDFTAQLSLSFFVVGVLGLRGRRLALLLVSLSVLAESGPVLVSIAAVSVIWGDVLYFVFETTLVVLLFCYLLRGWRKGNVDAKLLLIPYGISQLVPVLNNFGNTLISLNIPHSDAIVVGECILLRRPFQISVSDVAGMASILGMLAVLVYRFARTNREQQRLASALQAAHDIQNRLVPVDIPTLGGLHTEIAYRAAEEVGGDFCQILPRPDGSIFVAIGDVSGKGLQAAMLGAVAVGALRSLAEEHISPAAALERLNRVLLGTEYFGFTTCLCLILNATGEVTIANAGHLPPYLDGAEVNISGGLPLGLISEIECGLASFLLPESARLTLLSDGVVEARSATGELFGFERTAELSRLTASEIADRAYQFGQRDDITVITLDWQSVALPALSTQHY